MSGSSVSLSPFPLSIPLSLTLVLFLPLCFVSGISPHSKGFDEILSRQNVTVWNVILRSDVSETRPVISFGMLDFISSLFSFMSALTNTIAQGNHLWLPSFSPTCVVQRKLSITLERKQHYSSCGYSDFFHLDIHHFLWCFKAWLKFTFRPDSNISTAARWPLIKLCLVTYINPQDMNFDGPLALLCITTRTFLIFRLFPLFVLLVTPLTLSPASW